MNKTIINSRLVPLYNIQRKPLRAAGLIVLVALIAFIVFGGTIITLSLKNGLNVASSRFGADLVIVPEGQESNEEAILLQGTPNLFYFGKSNVDKIKDVEGIEQITTQYFLTSASAGCCDVPIQIIGFDADTDFAITPWINRVYNKKLEQGDVVIGSNVQVSDSKKIKFYNHEYNIAATLERTGTGLDDSVFTVPETLKDIAEASKEQGYNFAEEFDVDGKTSTILIKVKDGYNIEKVKRQIEEKVTGVSIVSKQGVVANLSGSLVSFSNILYIFIGLFLVLGIVTLEIAFSLIANSRRKEYGILRVIGYTKTKLAALMLKESIIVSLIGAVIGIITSSLFTYAFRLAIQNKVGVPYVSPSIGQLAIILLISLAITLIIGPLSAAYGAWKITKEEPAHLIKVQE